MGPGLALGTALIEGAALPAELGDGAVDAPPVDGAGEAAPAHAARNAPNDRPAPIFRNSRREYDSAMVLLLGSNAQPTPCWQ